ncbi:MAG: hypothetical protein E7001_03050 [Coriobacteriaceae bacterium]|nr:hypothetical protein [Coriobacteriaceae bacterium]
MALGAYVTKFTAKLDQIIERETLTADLNMNGDLLGEFADSGEIKVAKLSMDGLANYDRAKGFVPGNVSTDWETFKLRHDRAREFEVDAIDDEERAAVLSANLMAEFERTKVIPEVDAVRFATIATNAGGTAAAKVATPAEALKALLAGEQAVEDAGADLSQCVLYCTSAFKGLIRQAQPYRLDQGADPNGSFKTFDEMKLVTVPSARFQTKFDLLDGTTSGQNAGGFKPAADAKAIDFLIVHPSAVAAIQRHEKLRYFAPDANQSKDAHLWQYRLYHDLLVYEAKKPLIYAHTASAKA